MHLHENFSLGQYCYAVDLSTFTSNEEGHATVNALWVEIQEEELTLCKGQLFAYDSPTFLEFQKNLNKRYGGHVMYRWDGYQMWSATNDFRKMMVAFAEMEPALQRLPLLPDKYTGWFSIKD